ncbi:MAG TPA: hypothetical protein VIT45_09580 [Allosphingosinicella sp.]
MCPVEATPTFLPISEARWSRASIFLGTTCVEAVLPAFLSKYGPPTLEQTEERKTILDKTYQHVTSVWVKNGATITLVRDVGDSDEFWSVTYEPVTESGI